MSELSPLRMLIREFLSSTGGIDARGWNDRYPGNITRSDRETLHNMTKHDIPEQEEDLPDHLKDEEDTELTVPKQEKGTTLSMDPYTRGLDLTYGRLGV